MRISDTQTKDTGKQTRNTESKLRPTEDISLVSEVRLSGTTHHSVPSVTFCLPPTVHRSPAGSRPAGELGDPPVWAMWAAVDSRPPAVAAPAPPRLLRPPLARRPESDSARARSRRPAASQNRHLLAVTPHQTRPLFSASPTSLCPSAAAWHSLLYSLHRSLHFLSQQSPPDRCHFSRSSPSRLSVRRSSRLEPPLPRQSRADAVRRAADRSPSRTAAL